MTKPHVVLGVTGCIGAYRACDVVRDLLRAGAEVSVIMTAAAQRFVSPLTFQTLSRNRVYTEVFTDTDDFRPDHIALVNRGGVLAIAPATANVMGKIACGVADEIVSLTAMSFEGPKIIAPAMNFRMWRNPAVVKNAATLKTFGWEFVGPDEGSLACGEEGIGRLAPVADIVSAIAAKF